MPKEQREEILPPELYRRDPEFFVKAMAYRLLFLLIPWPLTYLLPRELRGAPVKSDFLLAPKDTLPEGVTWNTYYIFPEDWTKEEPFPPGIVQEPGSVWPDDWVRGEPLPPGFDFDPSTIEPDGWNPDNLAKETMLGYGGWGGPSLPLAKFNYLHWLTVNRKPYSSPPYPPRERWKTYFSDTYWNPEPFNGVMEWTGSRWHGKDNSTQYQGLRAKGTWANGYQPKQCKISWTCPAERWIYVLLSDEDGHGIGDVDGGGSQSNVIIDLEYAAKGIDFIEIGTDWMYVDFYIDDLQWL